MAAILDQSLAGIPTMSRQALCVEYRRLYQLAPPIQLSRRLLELAIAYRMQELVLGGLNSSLQRQLIGGRAPTKSLSDGSLLVREWHGVHHTVVIRDQHVEYRDQKFKSLSAVARLITGSSRSGPVFFGLKGATHGA